MDGSDPAGRREPERELMVLNADVTGAGDPAVAPGGHQEFAADRGQLAEVIDP